MQRLEGLPSPDEIRGMVDAFYAVVRVDPLLGPIFEGRVTDWDLHLDRMTSFWSAVLLAHPGFRGDPVGKHRGMSELEPHHYDRWLELFGKVLGGLFEPEMAANIHARAVRMRVVLESQPAS
jgi:hemoglobin